MKKRKLPRSQALQVWKRRKHSNFEIIKLMPGWNLTAAYKELGPRGLPRGIRAGR